MLSMLPEARGCKKRWIAPGTIIKGLETIPFSKALPCPVQSTYWEHWADRGDGGMRAGWAPAAKRREGREGWRRAGRRRAAAGDGLPGTLLAKKVGRKQKIK